MTFRRFPLVLPILTIIACIDPVNIAIAQTQLPFNSQLLNAIAFRNVGPFRIGARIAGADGGRRQS